MNTITLSKKLQGFNPAGGQNRLEQYIPINTAIIINIQKQICRPFSIKFLKWSP